MTSNETKKSKQTLKIAIILGKESCNRIQVYVKLDIGIPPRYQSNDESGGKVKT